MVNLNDIAPNFNLPDETGALHSLEEFRGKKVVLYFYPKDNTSGCTSQALGFKDLFEEFKNLNCVVIGISKDSVKSHLNFKNKYQFPFILLSDESTEVLNQYGVWQEKSMYGRKYFGVVRTTFVIDENGKVISKEVKVNANQNPNDTLCFIKGI